MLCPILLQAVITGALATKVAIKCGERSRRAVIEKGNQRLETLLQAAMNGQLR
jgi:hypothetical protein